MTGRSRSFDRCPRCRQRPALCLCAEIPRIETAAGTRLVVLMHRFEERHTTNTGRLATLALPGSELLFRGDPARPLDPRAFDPGAGQSIVLFPDDNAPVLDPALASTLRRPVTLIVPDGNWRQASRAVRREPAIANLPRVKLAPGAPSAYRLRCAGREGALATLEAIARALGVLEGESVQRALESLFLATVERVLWSRGRISDEEVTTGVPAAARAEALASGRRHPQG